MLTAIDIFSRFVWLRPLTSKSSKVVAKKLEGIYMEHGAPRIIQSDRGGEFKKAVKKLCDRMNIKLIYSRPRHPQSQGKVERCHRSLRSKIEYDLNKMGKDGVNWVKQLSLYQIILNNDPKEVIAFKTPFEIYFARRCSSIKESGLVEECLPSSGRIHPTGNDQKRSTQNASKVRKQAQKATKRCEKRAQRTQRRLNPSSVYSIGETVYVRLRGSALNKRHVIEASIERRNSKLHTYEVSYISPHSGKKERKWVPVDDITSITLRCEKQKQQEARLSKRKKQEHHKKYLITKGKEDYAQAIEDQGFHIVYNPPGDGSCQFAEIDDAFNVDDRGKEGSSDHDTEIRNGEDDLREVEIGDSDQMDRIDQNEDINEITDDGLMMALQFVPDEEVGFLAPKIRSSNIEDLPNELLEKIFKIMLMSSAVLFAGNAFHAYQRFKI